MIESRRLNKTFECAFCKQQVNPYVLEERAGVILVECPSCGKDDRMPKESNDA